MQTTISVLVFFSLLTLIRGLQIKEQAARIDVHGRLKQVMSGEETVCIRQVELSRPLSERIFRPLLIVMAQIATRLLPGEVLQRLEKKVQQSGGHGALSARDYLGLKVLLALGLPTFVYLMHRGVWSAQLAVTTVFAVIIGWRFPEIQLKRSARIRCVQLEKIFPEVLDLLTVSVGAGLGFDGALAKVVEKSNGPVSDEFKRVLQEIKMGKSRRDAMRDFGDRSGVADIKTFTGAIVQADQLGINISSTLKHQAEQMRRKRRQRVEEQAMKAPVKMLIPLLVFIFPTIFIVLLGPALIQILENFAVM
ncbi:MAG: type II secretion system F family protein [Dethiobacter sp.]|jgi:tight adherence protein C|nr:type II secretion system F family protein [Dethiobacter sp.]MBS3990045.1 type II secretion system F family protein [Dethiobacter sp.]